MPCASRDSSSERVNETAETEATSLAAIAASQKISVKEFEKQHKYHLNRFTNWSQRGHADTWMLFPENVGPQLSIDEVAVTNGELYTVPTNKAAHGKQRALVAMMEGTKVCAMAPILANIPFEKKTLVTEVTPDMSESMQAIVKQAFPNTMLVPRPLPRPTPRLRCCTGNSHWCETRSHQRREHPDQTSSTGKETLWPSDV